MLVPDGTAFYPPSHRVTHVPTLVMIALPLFRDAKAGVVALELVVVAFDRAIELVTAIQTIPLPVAFPRALCQQKQHHLIHDALGVDDQTKEHTF